jgi:macrolide-specific efflux system membrane fusion protein
VPTVLRRSLNLWLTAVLLAACSTVSSPEALTPTPLPPQPALARPTYQVQRGNVITLLQFDGRVATAVEAALYFRADGRVRKVNVSEKAAVKAGQVLADLETVDGLTQQRAVNQLALRRAQANLDIARLQLEWAKAQATPSPQPDYQVAIKEQEVELAQIGMDEVKLTMQDLDATIAGAQILAPFDGQVLTVNIANGDNVTAYQTVIVIGVPDNLEVSAILDSGDLAKLSEGMTVTVTPADQPGQALDGHIRRLPYAYAGGGNTTVSDRDRSVRITLDSQTAAQGLGTRVRVTIVVGRANGVLWLAPQAIRTFNDRVFVVVQDGAVQRRVDVKVGLQSDDRVEIVAGLSEGQVVVAP